MGRQLHFNPIKHYEASANKPFRILERTNFFSKREILELPKVLVPGEKVLAIISGFYAAGTAVLCVTSKRLLLIDKKMIRLSLEDIRFESIREVHYSHQPILACMQLYYAGRQMQFKTWHKKELRLLSQLVQQKMFEVADGSVESQAQNVVESGRTSASTVDSSASYAYNPVHHIDHLRSQLEPIQVEMPSELSSGNDRTINQQAQRLQAAGSFVDKLRISTKAGHWALELTTATDLLYPTKLGFRH